MRTVRVTPGTERVGQQRFGRRVGAATMVEHGHDYTYDMAHEMKVIARLPRQRRGSSRPPVAPRDLDPDTDLGHDQAHEV